MSICQICCSRANTRSQILWFQHDSAAKHDNHLLTHRRICQTRSQGLIAACMYPNSVVYLYNVYIVLKSASDHAHTPTPCTPTPLRLVALCYCCCSPYQTHTSSTGKHSSALVAFMLCVRACSVASNPVLTLDGNCYHPNTHSLAGRNLCSLLLDLRSTRCSTRHSTPLWL